VDAGDDNGEKRGKDKGAATKGEERRGNGRNRGGVGCGGFLHAATVATESGRVDTKCGWKCETGRDHNPGRNASRRQALAAQRAVGGCESGGRFALGDLFDVEAVGEKAFFVEELELAETADDLLLSEFGFGRRRGSRGGDGSNSR